MAPATELSKRQNNDSTYCDYYGCYSNWDNWGRWVALVVIVLVLLAIAFLFSCFNSRRRRRAGRAPMYGTGWLPYHNSPNYNPNVANPPKYGEPGYHPPPPYIPGQATGTTFNSNEGYYGNHGGNGGQQGIELQQPSSSYQPQRGGDPVYDAPAGPPPGKAHWGSNDHVIR